MHQELEPIVTTDMEQLAVHYEAWLMVTDVTLSRRQVGILVSEPEKARNYWARSIAEGLDYARSQGVKRLLICSEMDLAGHTYYLLELVPMTVPARH